jgi:hypothetical protein
MVQVWLCELGIATPMIFNKKNRTQVWIYVRDNVFVRSIWDLALDLAGVFNEKKEKCSWLHVARCTLGKGVQIPF